MKWMTKQIDMYLQAKEYVDTAIIPLIPIDWKNDFKGKVAMGEFTTSIVDEIERQFTGRVFQIIPFTYLSEEETDDKVARLLAWDKQLFENGFKHIIYITSDSYWKSVEDNLTDMLIWLPALSLESMDDTNAKQIMDQQVSQVLPMITNKWKEEPKSR